MTSFLHISEEQHRLLPKSQNFPLMRKSYDSRKSYLIFSFIYLFFTHIWELGKCLFWTGINFSHDYFINAHI